ncbi:hypothetical protein CDO09_00625 [Xanthomonas perforans]|nr:hypothetical protein CDO09_00625 [Xanthomonas perforans]
MPHRPCCHCAARRCLRCKKYTIVGQLEEAGRPHAWRPDSHGYKDQTDLRVQCKRTERGNALVHCAPLGE